MVFPNLPGPGPQAHTSIAIDAHSANILSFVGSGRKAHPVGDAYGFWSALELLAAGGDPRSDARPANTARRNPDRTQFARRDLYVVDFGLFEVRDAKDCAVDEIGADELIGEIGFFADAPRNASVVAVRDSQVLEIDRATFDALSDRIPKIERAATRALARRLASLTPKAHERVRAARAPRVVVIVGAGASAISEPFLTILRRTVEMQPGARYVTSADLPECFAQDAVEAISWPPGWPRSNAKTILSFASSIPN